MLLRLFAGKQGQPSAVILDGRTMQSTPESVARAGVRWPACNYSFYNSCALADSAV